MTSLKELIADKPKTTMLIYGQPGTGKSTALGYIAAKSEGKSLVLDVDRTFVNAIRLMPDEIRAKVAEKVDVISVDNISTFDSWSEILKNLNDSKDYEKYDNIMVDNVSELERCILSDLGSKGKNKGVPAQADYQYMQFKLVNSLRFMKSFGRNLYMTAWETTEQYQNPDGSGYSRKFPQISAKIVNNICGLCDCVAKVHVNKDGARGFILDATENVYAKNQVDSRKICRVEEF